MTNGEPVRQQTANLLRGGMKYDAGTLLLYPDRLVHVASSGMKVGMAFGAVGMLLTQSAAKRKAAARAAEGGDGVISVPFDGVRALRRGKQGLNKNLLVVDHATEGELKFAVKFDKWAPDIARAMEATGRTANTTPDGITFA